MDTQLEGRLRALDLPAPVVDELIGHIEAAGAARTDHMVAGVEAAVAASERQVIASSKAAEVDGEPIPFGDTHQHANCLARAFSNYLENRKTMPKDEAWSRYEQETATCDANYGEAP